MIDITPDQKEIRERKVLIVEGDDDRRIFEELLKKLGITGVHIHSLRGHKSLLTKFLKTLPNRPEFEDIDMLGIIVDADENKESKIQSVKDHLRINDFSVPDSICTLSTQKKPFTCFIVIPPNENSGKIEHVCYKSVEDDKALPCIESMISCLKKNLPENEFPNDPIKAKTQIFMASRREICPHIGIAAKKSYWNFDHSIFDEIKNFLSLFKKELSN